MIVGVLLAAGRGERFGGDKLRQPLTDGRPMAIAALDALLPAVDEIVVVVDAGNTSLLSLLRAQTRARTLPCDRTDRGMGYSLRCGVDASREADGWLVALGDMPYIQTATIERVVSCLRDGGALLAAPEYRGCRGHPVGFAAIFKDALLALDGDRGARNIVTAHRQDLQLLHCNDPGVLFDIDAAADLAPPFTAPTRGNI